MWEFYLPRYMLQVICEGIMYASSVYSLAVCNRYFYSVLQAQPNFSSVCALTSPRIIKQFFSAVNCILCNNNLFILMQQLHQFSDTVLDSGSFSLPVTYLLSMISVFRYKKLYKSCLLQYGVLQHQCSGCCDC